jgi:hypothetical protein
MEMKLVRRISLFLIMPMLLLAVGGYTALKAEQFFYPNRYGESEHYSVINDETDTETPQVIETAAEEIPVITADTVYLVEEVDLTKGIVNEVEENIPVKYIGLDRDAMLEELASYDANPPLTELEQGFESIELSAFSKDRVVVCKYYREEEDKGFYLMVADHFIVVYEEDMMNLYMNTDILLESLDETLQKEIIQGKYIENEDELYHFLESYSS